MTLQMRPIPDRLQSPLQRRLKSWETLLLAVAIAIFIVNSFASPYFLNAWNLSDATFNFTEKAMIAFAMALLIISGEIDLSVASIIALASTAMGAAVQAGAGTPTLIFVGLGTGILCGTFNGILVSRMGLPSIVVTIGTMSLFRGISYITLGDQAYRGYPPEFAFFGQGYVWWVISFEFVLFAIIALIYGCLLHKTNFGGPFTQLEIILLLHFFKDPCATCEIHFICSYGIYVRDCSYLSDVSPRFDTAVNCLWLGIGGGYNGGFGRCEYFGWIRVYPRSCYCSSCDGPCHLWVRALECSRNCYVNCYWRIVDRRDRLASYLVNVE